MQKRIVLALIFSFVALIAQNNVFCMEESQEIALVENHFKLVSSAPYDQYSVRQWGKSHNYMVYSFIPYHGNNLLVLQDNHDNTIPEYLKSSYEQSVNILQKIQKCCDEKRSEISESKQKLLIDPLYLMVAEYLVHAQFGQHVSRGRTFSCGEEDQKLPEETAKLISVADEK